VLAEIFPISLRGGGGHRGGIPGLPEVPGLFTPNEREGPVADRVAAGGPLKPKEAAAVALWRLGGGVGKAPEIVAGGNRALAPPISRAYHHRAGGPRIL
jgi:hypothetical protein